MTLKEQWLSDAALFNPDAGNEDVFPFVESGLYTVKATAATKTVSILVDDPEDALADDQGNYKTMIAAQMRSDATAGIAIPVAGDTIVIRGILCRIENPTTRAGYHILTLAVGRAVA